MTDRILTDEGEIEEREAKLPMVPQTLPAQRPALDIDRELIKQIAMDIGVEMVDYIRRQFPAAMNANPDTFRVSICNGIYNEIMAAVDAGDADAIKARLSRREAQRKEIRRLQAIGRKAVIAREGDAKDAVYLSERKIRAAAEAHCTALRVKPWKDHSEDEKAKLCEAMQAALSEYLGRKWR